MKYSRIANFGYCPKGGALAKPDVSRAEICMCIYFLAYNASGVHIKYLSALYLQHKRPIYLQTPILFQKKHKFCEYNYTQIINVLIFRPSTHITRTSIKQRVVALKPTKLLINLRFRSRKMALTGIYDFTKWPHTSYLTTLLWWSVKTVIFLASRNNQFKCIYSKTFVGKQTLIKSLIAHCLL